MQPTGIQPTALLAVLFVTGVVSAQEPAYERGQGPLVLVDADYRNLLSQRLRPSLTKGLESDGYRVSQREGELSPAALQGVTVMIVASPVSEANALPVQPPGTQAEFAAQVAAAWRLPTPSAYSTSEIESLVRWVENGGAILIIVDHMPFPGPVQDLAARFGVQLANGIAFDGRGVSAKTVETVGGASTVQFSLSDRSLASHAITAGRTTAEHIEAVETYGGSAFRMPESGQSLMTFGETYVQLLPEVMWEFSDATPQESIAGWSQGGVVQFGRGRVAMFGEAGVFMDAPLDDNRPKELRAQNHQLLLNTMHWLSGALK